MIPLGVAFGAASYQLGRAVAQRNAARAEALRQREDHRVDMLFLEQGPEAFAKWLAAKEIVRKRRLEEERLALREREVAVREREVELLERLAREAEAVVSTEATP